MFIKPSNDKIDTVSKGKTVMELILGRCEEVMETIPDKSIDLILTSPPYWAKRIYESQEKDENPIGAEPTPIEYVNRMADLFTNMSRVLKDEGNLFVNIGDTYFGSGAGASSKYATDESLKDKRKEKYLPTHALQPKIKNDHKLYQPKQLLMIPARFAIAMQERGWILREDIIWRKTNPVPSGVRDRCNTTYEHIFHFVKQRKYYFDIKGIKVMGKNGKMKNMGDVWDIPTQALQGTEHTASFPEELARRIIKSACPEGGRVFEPFLGTGTTCLVAEQENRESIGCEISKEYMQFAKQRIEKGV